MPLATGETPTVELPLGTHRVTLQVTDSNGAMSSDLISLTVEPSPGTATNLIAGWDTWSSPTAPIASILAPGVTGSAVTTTEGLNWNTVDERGASADGDWGTFAGPPSADTSVADTNNQNLELPNATTGGTITFTITNSGSTDLAL